MYNSVCTFLDRRNEVQGYTTEWQIYHIFHKYIKSIIFTFSIPCCSLLLFFTSTLVRSKLINVSLVRNSGTSNKTNKLERNQRAFVASHDNIFCSTTILDMVLHFNVSNFRPCMTEDLEIFQDSVHRFQILSVPSSHYRHPTSHL